MLVLADDEEGPLLLLVQLALLAVVEVEALVAAAQALLITLPMARSHRLQDVTVQTLYPCHNCRLLPRPLQSRRQSQAHHRQGHDRWCHCLRLFQGDQHHQLLDQIKSICATKRQECKDYDGLCMLMKRNCLHHGRLHTDSTNQLNMCDRPTCPILQSPQQSCNRLN